MRGLVAAVLAGLLASGCGGSPEPRQLPAPEKSGSPSASATPTPPVMPSAAKTDNDAAVEAFARHFINVINYTAHSGDRATIDKLSAPACESCKSIGDRAERTYADGGYIRGQGWSVKSANVVPNQRRNGVYVELTIDQHPETVLARPGTEPTVYPGGDHTFNMVVSWAGSSWLVSRLDLVG
jgi:hypothetical protein